MSKKSLALNLVLGFSLKFIIVIFLVYNLGLPDLDKYIIRHGGDTPMYLTTAKSICKYGVYALHTLPGGFPEPYTGRMPGYEIVLVPLLYFFSPYVACHIVVLLQLSLAIISTICLAKIAMQLFRMAHLKLFVIIIYGVNTYVTVFDISIVPESFAVSSFIIGSYFFLCRNNHPVALLISGISLTWMVFLRPYMLPILGLYMGFVVYQGFRGNMRMIQIGAFCSAFLFFDIIWSIRNYNIKHRFIPVVDSLYGDYRFSTAEIALFEFIQSWGGDLIWWNPKAEVTFFRPYATQSGLTNENDKEIRLPGYIYTSRYNADSLSKLRIFYTAYFKEPGSFSSQQIDSVAGIVNGYKEAFISEKWYLHYFYAPIVLLKKFVWHSGTYNICDIPFEKQNLAQRFIKLIYSMQYILILVVGFGGVLFLWNRRQDLRMLYWYATPLYIVVLCPILLRRISYNYFIIAYPVLTTFAVASLLFIGQKLKKLLYNRRFL